MSDERIRQAICECGQLTVTVRGEPEHHHACTCTKCQRASGSVMTVTAWFARDRVVAVEGETLMWQTNGPGTEVYRCKRCGGGGYFLTGAYLPHCFGINVGHFADPAFTAPAHIHWWPNRPHWLEAPEGVVVFDGN